MKGFMESKGFVISFDALIAVLLLLSFFVATTIYLGKVDFKAGSSVLLKEIAMDSLTVLEKSGKLEKAISIGRSNELRAFLNQLPFAVCADLRLFQQNDLNNPSVVVLRPDCKKNFSESATVKRSVVVKDGSDVTFHLAELRAWYRVVE